ncbi:MAG: M1 family aminopeptidase [Bacteroidota bacterium]
MIYGRSSFYGLCSLILCIFSSCSSPVKQLGEGISRSLAESRKTQIADIAYHLSFEIPEDPKEDINGHLELWVSLQDTLQDLVLDFDHADSLVHQVRSEEGERVDFQTVNGHLVIPSRFLQQKNIFSIGFTAGNQALNRRKDYLYSLFVPANASSCFPVVDQPNIKGKYTLNLTIPDHWTALSNEAVVRTESIKNQKQLYFGETMPISSYLFAFTAGVFDSISTTIDDRTYTMLHREPDSLKVLRNADKIVEWHHKSMIWLEKYTQIDYPFNKFAFVLIPSFQFGGMEHPGAIYYKASSLFLDPSHTWQQEKNRARLIAHETAHMWFGDLVTMDWFNDVWLKEVFANFMAAKITQPEFPDIDHDLQFLLSHYPSAYEVDRTRGSHPIQQPLNNLKDAGSLYGNIIYQKSPVVMRMLEQNMGEENFAKGIRAYLQKYAFDNATWDDLMSIMKDYTDYDLDPWNQQWVKSAGMPEIKYNLRIKNDSVSKFTVFTGSKNDNSSIWWPQKLMLEIGTSDSVWSQNVNKDFRVFNVREASGLPSPNYVFNNANGMGYGFFEMKAQTRAYLLENVLKEENSVKRAAIWINLHESVLRGKTEAEKLLMVQVKSLAQEREPLILSYLIKSLDHLYWVYLTAEQREKCVHKIESVLVNQLIRSDKKVKVIYLNFLKRIASSEKALSLLSSLLDGSTDIEGLELSDRDKISIAYELVIRGHQGAVERLNAQTEAINNDDFKRRINFVRNSVVGNIKDRQLFFESFKVSQNRANEEWVLEALTYLHHPYRVEESVSMIQPSLELLQEIKKTGDIFFPKRWLDRTLRYHYSEDALDQVKQFLFRNNSYPQDLKNKILQSSDHLFRSVPARKKWDQKTGAEEEVDTL